jgi:transcriptional regulator with XRE-family HTH domain
MATPKPRTKRTPTPRKQAPPPPDTFGTRLRAAREAADLSQQELGDATGFDKRSVARYEQGGALPSIEAAARLAKPLGASLDALAGLSATSADPELARLFAQLTTMNEQDRAAIRRVLQLAIAPR